MIVLAFLQNMWFKDPNKVRAVFQRNPEHRNQLIATYLFMGCLTGRRLLQVFGDDLCDKIIWEECSPEIGGRACALFPPDVAHMRAAIEKHHPDIVLGFGAVAREALSLICPPGTRTILAPHPAARGNKTVTELKRAAERLAELLSTSSEGSNVHSNQARSAQ
jgi:hypothetical protein